MEVAFLILLVIFFVSSSYLSDVYSEELKSFVMIKGALGMFFYLGVAAVAEIIGPISAIPFLPLAAALWGSFSTAILSVFGWTIGAMLVFFLCRKFGRPLIKKFVDLSSVEEISGAISQKNLFLSILILRAVFPVDILSYAIGMFTDMRWPSYLLATFLGFIPFAFVLSYGVKLPLFAQIGAATAGIVIAVFGYKGAKKNIRRWLGI